MIEKNLSGLFGLVYSVEFPVVAVPQPEVLLARFSISLDRGESIGGMVAVTLIQRLISLLDYTYAPIPFGRGVGEAGFQNGVEIRTGTVRGKDVAEVRHEGWSMEKIEAFRAVIKALAPLHGWDVHDAREEPSAYSA